MGSFFRVAAFALTLAAAGAGARAADQGTGQERGSDAADVIVLLDTSQSVLPYFQDVTDFVVGSVVRDYLRYGDTFHLLSFGESVHVEIAEKMNGEKDVKSVLARLYLLYPLARYSDLVAAIDYLDQYLADLPESRRKVVVVISDGVDNPPSSSSSFGLSSDALVSAIESSAERIRDRGWPVHFIALPFQAAPRAAGSGSTDSRSPESSAATGEAAWARDPSGAQAGAPGSASQASVSPTSSLSPASSATSSSSSAASSAQAASSTEPLGASYLSTAARALGADLQQYSSEAKNEIARNSLSLPRVEFPGPLGKRSYSFSFPLRVTNDAESDLGLELESVLFGESEVLARRSFLKLPSGTSGSMEVSIVLPPELPEGNKKLELRLSFANGIRVSPQVGIVELALARNPFTEALQSGGRVALFIVLLALGLAAVLAVLLVVRRATKRSEAPVVAAVLESAAHEGAAALSPSVRIDSAHGTAAARKAEPAVSSYGSASGKRAAIEAAVEASAEKTMVAEEASEPSWAAAGQKDERDRATVKSAAAFAEEKRAEAERGATLLAEAARSASSPALPASSVSKAVAKAPTARETGVAPVPQPRKPLAPRGIAKPGSILVEMRVDDQNHNIGSRNVHLLRAGSAKSVGGGARSDFLVFLVRVPRRIGELSFDGERLSFYPLRPELFPDHDGVVEDCLGLPIRATSRTGYPLVLRFERYVRPTDRINRLLRCIEVPGLFSSIDSD